MFFRKRKPEPAPEQNLKLATVIDRHLSKYVRIVNINNSVKTGLILFGLTLFMFNIFMGSFEVKKTDHIASIAFTGAVSSENPLGNARDFADNFFKAANDKTAKAILIVANSGGGSPTQAEAINEIIRNYTAKPIDERKPVYVSIQEVCASACIMAIAAADKITTHAASLVGSISIRMDGYAIDKALERLSIERKVITTGNLKALFDPYRNVNDEEREFIKDNIMWPMHNQFVDAVKAGRGDKLDLSNELLFTGMVWPGSDSVKIGLTDQVQTTYYLEEELKEKYGVTEIKAYNRPSRFNLKGLFTGSFEQAIRNILSEEMTIRM